MCPKLTQSLARLTTTSFALSCLSLSPIEGPNTAPPPARSLPSRHADPGFRRRWTLKSSRSN